MQTLTGYERIRNILQRKPVDRIGIYEHFWGDTLKKWQDKGHIKAEEDLISHFGFDMDNQWCFDMVANLDFKPEIIEETEDTVLTRDGNGALLRRHKKHNATPEHVDFAVQERAQWEALILPFMKPDRRRIRFQQYREALERTRRNNRFFCWAGVNVFESMHPVCGHEHMLVGMATDPDWIRDMADAFAELTIGLLEILFAEEGKPDGLWFYEDMGFKHHPFMSATMYRELIQPAHQKTIAFAHAHDLPVIMHSCGFIEPLLPYMIEAGIDCLHVLEVKAGMDLLRIKKQFGSEIVLFGGMDARNLVANDLDAIEKELSEKIPTAKEGFGYILHSDHSIPTTTHYETYRFFVDRGLELGRYDN